MYQKRLQVLLMSLMMLFAFGRFSRANEGSLTPELIREIQKSVPVDARLHSVQNAVTANDIRALIVNREMSNRHDDHFGFKMETPHITDQKSTGRCWLFAALNTIRPSAMKKFNVKDIEFSQNYLFLWDKLEKANMFLEAMMETAGKPFDDREIQELLESPVADGGWWNFAVALIEKYGIVPVEIMPETINSEKSAGMDDLIDNLLRKDAVELRRLAADGKKVDRLRKEKNEMLADVYRLLVIHLGTPPSEFTWRYEDKDGKLVEKSFTPLSLYQEAYDFSLGDFVTIANHPSHPIDKFYTIKYCRNFSDIPDMRFVNLSMQQMKAFTLAMVLDTIPVWFAADTKYDMENKKGIMAPGIYDYESLFDVDLTLPRKERFQYRGSTPGHAMTFIGVDIQNDRPEKWLIENSWGTDLGAKGYWTMYDGWFDEYVFVVIINKSYLPENVLKLLESKPTELPIWDPIASMIVQ